MENFFAGPCPVTSDDGTPAVRPTRRGVVAGALSGLGALALTGCEAQSRGSSSASNSSSAATSAQRATWTVASGPPRQSGVTTKPGTHAHWVGLDLPDDATKDELRRALVVLDDAAARFVKGASPLPDVAHELAPRAGDVAIAVGLGPRVFDLDGMRAEAPAWLKPIPSLTIDDFEKPWKQTDLVVQVDTDNPVTVSHVVGQLVSALKGTATPRWQQRGFAAGARPSDGGVTRNLFGQLDGMEQPNVAGTEAGRVWNAAQPGASWMEGTTGMVIRRIRMNVDVWQSLDRTAQENAIGRRLTNGAPLTGTKATDPIDLEKTDELGLTVINPAAHVPRAMPKKTGERILRRPYSYEVARDDGTSDRGLVFVAFCADVVRQFVPIQQRLAEADLLNTWTTPIGSGVYLLPAAPRPGRYLGQDIVEA